MCVHMCVSGGVGLEFLILREVKQEVFEGEITLIFYTVTGTECALEAFLKEYFFRQGMESSKEKLEEI